MNKNDILENILENYLRQVEVIGREKQKMLVKSSALVVGAGGLGSATIPYLAGAGVGKIGIADGDYVERSNIHRQIIHAGNIGMNKAESAKKFIKKINANIKVKTYSNITHKNWEIIKEYDIVISCPDNFKTRFLLNDACVLTKKPLVHGAIYGFEGEVALIEGRPCYRCLYSYASEVNSSSILTPVAGVIGCLQALIAVKRLCNIEQNVGYLFRFDFKFMEFMKFKIAERRDCPVCSGKLKGVFPENYLKEKKYKILRLK